MENQFILKSKVIFNNQSIQYLSSLKGKHAFIVSDGIMDELGYLKKCCDLLQDAGIQSTVFTGVRPDPSTLIISAGLKEYQSSSADILIAIGGGSAIDTAKGILYFDLEIQKAGGLIPYRPLFIAIPSTSGTGSEVTNFSVITKDTEKLCIVDETITPDIAILDSTCLQHVPEKVVVDTGIDVLVHAIEAFVSEKSTDFTDAMAEKSIRLLFQHLETLHKDVQNQEARDAVQNASCMAGMAFTNAGLGITHSLAHGFGGNFHISHGRSNGLFLSSVIAYNAELEGSATSFAAHRYASIAKLLQLPARTPREGTVSLLQAIHRLKRTLGIEESIRHLKISETAYRAAAENMAVTALHDRCTPTNPRKPTKEDLYNLYLKAF